MENKNIKIKKKIINNKIIKNKIIKNKIIKKKIIKKKIIKYYHSIGKRKTSIASIYLYKKNKNKKYFIKINKLKYNIYFKNNNIIIYKILFPLIITKNINKFHININIKGGGYTGQSEAISLGISKILYLIDNKYKKILKKYYLLTRDSRIVERKKYGRKKARKKFQFSKR